MTEQNDIEANLPVLVKKIVTINAAHFCLKLHVFSEIPRDNDILDDYYKD